MAANNLVNTKQDLISAFVQKELKENASLLPLISDLSSLAIKGAKSVSVPKLSSFTVNDRAFGVAGTESAPLIDAVDTINLDKNKYIKVGYDAADAIQSTIDYQMLIMQKQASAHGRQINIDIVTTLANIAGLDLASVADITVDDILDMREYMFKSFADMTKVYLLIAADQEKAMLKLPEFSRYDYRGNGTAPVVNGMIGTVYGVPVVVNQTVPAGQAFMFEANGIALAFQRTPAVAEESDLDYGTQGKKIVADCLYGVGGLQLGENGAAAGKSPLVAKLK